MHLHHSANALFLALNRVVYGIALGKHAGINPNKRQRADERIGSDFKSQRGEWRLVVSRPAFHGAIFKLTFDGLHLGRCWQIFNNRIEHGLHTFIFESRTTQYWHYFVSQCARAYTLLDLLLAELFTLEVFIHQIVIGLGRRLYQLLAHLCAQISHVGRNISVLERRALISLVP